MRSAKHDRHLADDSLTMPGSPKGPAQTRTSRPFRRLVVWIAVFGLLSSLVLFFSDLHLLFGLGNGSTSYANQWNNRFQEHPDPDTVQRMYSEVAVRQFAEGKWIFGVCEDSHSSIW